MNGCGVILDVTYYEEEEKNRDESQTRLVPE